MNSRNAIPKPDDDKITREEFRNLMKAMDREGFDTLMEDYMKEVSNPDNTLETNTYLKQAEMNNDLPKNVKLASPSAGFCIKSCKYSLKRPALRQKVYINICSYSGVSAPKEDSRNMWSLPHLLNKGRQDQDKKGKVCTIFDVVFHPDAIAYSQKSLAFKKYVCDSSINGLNNNLLKSKGEKISSDYVLKKFNYKGKEIALINVHSLNSNELDSRMESADDHKTKMQKEIDKMKENENEENETEKHFDKTDLNSDDIVPSGVVYPIAPKFKIKYSDDFEMHKFFYDPSVTGHDQYQKLIVEMNVPLMDNLNFAEVNLDKRKLHLKYKELYLLDLDLPVEVDKDKSNAKFDRKLNLLTISALIVRKHKEELKLKVDENIEIVRDEETENEEKNKNSEIIEKEEITHTNTNLNTNSSGDVEEENKKNKKYFDKEESKQSNTAHEETKNIEPKQDNKINSESDSCLKTETKLKNELLEIGNKPETNINNIVKNSKTDIATDQSDKNDHTDLNSTINNSQALVTEIQRDEDDLPQEVNKDELTTQNNPENKTFPSDLMKISYINFNCDIIYEID